jgi:acyl-[acyl carrier protein]--UDP-N-acetylglucosamine O-acyltransferase
VNALNIVGLRRAGHRDSIAPLKRAFDIVFKSGLANQAAAKRILDELGDDPLCVELAEFIVGTKRGITAFGGDADADER